MPLSEIPVESWFFSPLDHAISPHDVLRIAAASLVPLVSPPLLGSRRSDGLDAGKQLQPLPLSCCEETAGMTGLRRRRK